MASCGKNNYDENNHKIVKSGDLSYISLELPGKIILWSSDVIVGPVNDKDAWPKRNKLRGPHSYSEGGARSNQEVSDIIWRE